jgi:hypothetical protein
MKLTQLEPEPRGWNSFSTTDGHGWTRMKPAGLFQRAADGESAVPHQPELGTSVIRVHPCPSVVFNSSVGSRVWVWGLLPVLLASALAASAQSTNTPTHQDYSAFKLINDRNIFNPNRSARSGGRTETRREIRPTARTEAFALVGIMDYEKGRFAFFDSASSQYKKVVQTTEAIADFKLLAIAPNSVKLVSGTNKLELPVGMQLSREPEGEWQLGTARAESSTAGEGRASSSGLRAETNVVQVVTGGEPLAPPDREIPVPPESLPLPIPTAEAEAVNTNTNTNTEAPAATAGGESDVLRRLMQRREQELNR